MSSPRLQSGQAAVLMAVVIALLFALFTLVFEVGRLLIAREVAISATRRAGEAGLSYVVDYAQTRSDWNALVLNARRNAQVWQPFYEEKTGIPKWVRAQTLRYLQSNLKDHLNLLTIDSIDKLGPESITFPFKEPNWPTSTIGSKLRVTIEVPLILLGSLSPTVPITVETTSITTINEILGIPDDAVAVIGAGGQATEFTGHARAIPGSTKNWVEPFNHFIEARSSLINQPWGCPPEVVSAYAYAGGRHTGIDFGVPENTQLFAVQGGKVESVGPYPNQKQPGLGNMAVILDTSDGFRVTYMHMLNIVVKQGQDVTAGDLIGVSDGDPKLHGAFAGFSSGAHLHFQVAQGKFYDFPFDEDPSPLLGLPPASDTRIPKFPKGQCYGP